MLREQLFPISLGYEAIQIVIIPLLSDSWLDESESQMKKTLKTKILEIVPAKCDD
jgi:hypothetical protein